MARPRTVHSITLPSGVVAKFREAGCLEFLQISKAVELAAQRGDADANLEYLRRLLVSVDGKAGPDLTASLAGQGIDGLFSFKDLTAVLSAVVKVHTADDAEVEASLKTLAPTVG